MVKRKYNVDKENKYEYIKTENGVNIVINYIDDTEETFSVVLISRPAPGLIEPGYLHLLEHIEVTETIKKFVPLFNGTLNANVSELNSKIKIYAEFDYFYDRFLDYKMRSSEVRDRIKVLDDYFSHFIESFISNNITQDRIDREIPIILSEYNSSTDIEFDWIKQISPMLNHFTKGEEIEGARYTIPQYSYDILGSREQIQNFNVNEYNNTREKVFKKENTLLIFNIPKNIRENENINRKNILNKYFLNTLNSLGKLKSLNVSDKEISKKKEFYSKFIEENYLFDNKTNNFYIKGDNNRKTLFIKFPNAVDKKNIIPLTMVYSYLFKRIFFKLRTRYNGFYSPFTFNDTSYNTYVNYIKNNTMYLFNLFEVTEEGYKMLKEDIDNDYIVNMLKKEWNNIISDSKTYDMLVDLLTEIFVNGYHSSHIDTFIKEVFCSNIEPENNPKYFKGKSFWDIKGSLRKITNEVYSDKFKRRVLKEFKNIEIGFIYELKGDDFNEKGNSFK